MIKRKFFSKIPLQGNVYPMPSGSYLEDSEHRLSLLSAQPLGVASLQKGLHAYYVHMRPTNKTLPTFATGVAAYCELVMLTGYIKLTVPSLCTTIEV